MLPTLARYLRRKIPWWTVRATQPRFLVGVVGLLRTPDGRILLLENRFWQGNRWGCPAGYMKRGESPERTIAREAREECDVAVRDLRVARVEAGSPHRIAVWCTGTVDLDRAPTRLQSWEITGAALLEPEAALARMRSTQAAVVRELLASA